MRDDDQHHDDDLHDGGWYDDDWHDDDCHCPACQVIEVIRDVAADVYQVATAGHSDQYEPRPDDPSWPGSKLKAACTDVAIRAVYAARNRAHFEPVPN